MDIHLKKTYKVVILEFPEELHDSVLGLIHYLDFIGIEEIHDVFKVTFDSSNYDQSTLDTLIQLGQKVYPKLKFIDVVDVEEQNWNEDWENSIEPIWINESCVITPLWKVEEVKAKYKIVINPKMSFGTGHHTTTRLMSQLALKHVSKGSFWIDAGSGTGLLAILASKLGAKKVFAFDNDEWSTDNINENIALNGISNIQAENADIYKIELPPSDGIFANLFLHLVIDSFPKFFDSLKQSKGVLLVSGILKYDEDIVITNAIQSGFSLGETLYEDEWVAFQFQIR